MSTIAFIGLGNMGGGMAANLVKAGHDVHAFDLSPAALTAAAAAGCATYDNVEAAVAGVDALVSMLPNGPIVDDVYRNHVIGHAPEGAILIDCSTIDVATARSTINAAENAGYMAVDSPVSGGIAAANAGTLTFMVGGSEAQLERARPLLEKMGANIFHAGAVGAGQTAKICNNMLLGILMVGTSEAIALGVANGLDPKVLSEIMRRSSGGNWALEKYNPFPGVHENAPASKGYAGGFGTDLMLKDLGLAQENAMATKASTPLGGLARAIYAAHSIAGHGGEDFSSVIKMLQKKG